MCLVKAVPTKPPTLFRSLPMAAPHSPVPPSSDPELVSWLQVVERKVAGLRFGSVQIVVHEGRVTQIESTEKFRFQSRPPGEPASPEEGEE